MMTLSENATQKDFKLQVEEKERDYERNIYKYQLQKDAEELEKKNLQRKQAKEREMEIERLRSKQERSIDEKASKII